MMFQLTLRRRGISDQIVLRAMEEVPRELFVDDADRYDRVAPLWQSWQGMRRYWDKRREAEA